jgi:hypothetical protein
MSHLLVLAALAKEPDADGYVAPVEQGFHVVVRAGMHRGTVVPILWDGGSYGEEDYDMAGWTQASSLQRGSGAVAPVRLGVGLLTARGLRLTATGGVVVANRRAYVEYREYQVETGELSWDNIYDTDGRVAQPSGTAAVDYVIPRPGVTLGVGVEYERTLAKEDGYASWGSFDGQRYELRSALQSACVTGTAGRRVSPRVGLEARLLGCWTAAAGDSVALQGGDTTGFPNVSHALGGENTRGPSAGFSLGLLFWP